MLFETKSILGTRAEIRPEPLRRVARAPSRRSWLRILSEVLTLSEGQGELLRHAERPWASATFSGARHTVALEFDGSDAVEAAERMIAALPDHEFSLTNQIVADASVASVDHTLSPAPLLTVEIEILVLDDL